MTREKFLELYERYKKMVYSVARSMTADAALADDAFQDAWIAIYRSFESFSGRSSLSTWIYSVARNAAVDAVRKNSNQARVSSPGPRQPAAAGAPENGPDVSGPLSRLGDDHRQVLSMKYSLAMSVREIAAELGLPESTVKSRLYEARMKLRDEMGP